MRYRRTYKNKIRNIIPLLSFLIPNWADFKSMPRIYIKHLNILINPKCILQQICANRCKTGKRKTFYCQSEWEKLRIFNL